MQTREFGVTAKRDDVRNGYRYSPVVGNNGNFLRAFTPDEMLRIIEISESAANPGKTNASQIPVFLFYNETRTNQASPPEVVIPPEVNKYYARLESFNAYEDQSGFKPYPDKPEALSNITRLHSMQAIENLRSTRHSLPMTIVYQIGMDDNHTGSIAIRICSFDDPSKNEVMVTNSLPGYEKWEQAAIKGAKEAMQNCALPENKTKVPNEIIITPATTPGIQQSSADMSASCGIITAAMSCAISPDVSFAEQRASLVNHMRGLCGVSNEAALRRDYQNILQLPVPWSNQFNRDAANAVLASCDKHRNVIPITTATTTRDIKADDANQLAGYLLRSGNELVSNMNKIQNNNISAYELFRAVTDPAIIMSFFASNTLRGFLTSEQLSQLRQHHFGRNVSPEAANKLISDLLKALPMMTPAQQQESYDKLVSGLNAKNTSLVTVLACMSDPAVIKQFFESNNYIAQRLNSDQIKQLQLIHFGETISSPNLQTVNNPVSYSPSSPSPTAHSQTRKHELKEYLFLMEKALYLQNNNQMGQWTTVDQANLNKLNGKYLNEFMFQPEMIRNQLNKEFPNELLPPRYGAFSAAQHIGRDEINPAIANIIIANISSNPALIEQAQTQLKLIGLTLLDVCEKVNDPIVINHMRTNQVLHSALTKENTIDKLFEMHASRWQSTPISQNPPPRSRIIHDPIPHHIHSSQLQLSPRNANEFAKVLIENPQLISSSRNQLAAAGLTVSNVLEKVDDKSLRDKFLANPTFQNIITKENQTRAPVVVIQHPRP